MEIRPQLRDVIRGFSIEELRELLKLREEVLAIARKPRHVAEQWLRLRRARGRLRALRTDPGRD